MANNHHQGGDVHPNSQDFIDQLLDMQNYAAASGDVPNLGGGGGIPMMLQLSGGFHAPPSFPLGLSLDQANPNSKPAFLNLRPHHGHGDGECEASSVNPARFRHPPPPLDAPPRNVFHGQPMASPVPAAPQQPTVRQRVRARRGQATDPHSIAERLRRERIAERIRALQEIVPSVNKTDRAAMLDEIVDYVKFLRLQVKVLSMSRLGGAGAVVPLVTDIPISSVEEEGGEGGQGQGQPVWEKWSNDGTERQVAKLMEENVGAAMQFLQSKALCIMPISLASAIYHTQPPDSSSHIKPESNPPS